MSTSRYTHREQPAGDAAIGGACWARAVVAAPTMQGGERYLGTVEAPRHGGAPGG